MLTVLGRWMKELFVGILPLIEISRFSAGILMATLFVMSGKVWGQCPTIARLGGSERPVTTSAAGRPTRKFDLIKPDTKIEKSLENPLQPVKSDPTLEILAFGDSVVWGDGLKPENKFVYLVGKRLANKTQRPVQIYSFAHSAARIVPVASGDPLLKVTETPIRVLKGEPSGDMDSNEPTTEQQIDCAIAAGHTDPEIVLLDGCINNVGAENIALPFVFNRRKTAEMIATNAAEYCRSMATVLNKAKGQFKHAAIVVVNYYQVVSCDTSFHRVFNHCPAGTPASRNPTAVTGNSHKTRSWWANSEAFLHTSQGCFEWAVSNANREQVDAFPAAAPFSVDHCPALRREFANPLQATEDKRVYLAEVSANPRYAYSGAERHLWILPIPTPFYFVFRQDEMYRKRAGLCNQAYPRRNWFVHPGTLVDSHTCHINAIAHPNREGAAAYAEAIAGSDSAYGILDIAWKRNGTQ